jgi:DNA-binding NtrC family response regulator
MLYKEYTMKNPEVYLLTKDVSLRRELSSVLPKGFRVVTQLSDSEDSFVFLDIDTLGTGTIREHGARTFVIAVTKEKRTGSVIDATTSGAYEVVHRPLRKEVVSSLILELQEIREELTGLIETSKGSYTIDPTCAIVGRSALIMDACKKLARLAQVEVPVLITGETGTGKELIAESIAQLSQRFGKPFVVINCAAIPDTLLESELFGFEKGAFTGALSAKEGFLKIADEGCVFFDEIGELPFPIQGKLLRFIQAQTFYPLGSTQEVQVNVRVISATNRDLSAMVRRGKFREDLYHRLSVASIHIPPLRKRKKDILPLIHFFIHRYRHTTSRKIQGVTQAFRDQMLSYDWPGKNTIRSAMALTKVAYLTSHELKDLGTHGATKKRTGGSDNLASALVPLLKEFVETKERDIHKRIHEEVDKHLLEYVLSLTKDNLSEAARILGINRLTLRKKLGIEPGRRSQR